MFLDKAKIVVKAGKGGDGMSSFRREKYVPLGGPSGGDGGRGGNIILVVDQGLSTLQDFRYKKQFKAEPGANGQTSNMHGKGAEDLLIKVPAGTLVKDAETGELIVDMVSEEQKFVLVKGGRGGRGNARFVNSVNRAPRFAEKGEPGENREVVLELKLLADVGLLGYPSVGKSSILARVSAAKPDIAAYHFTTLAPILGVVTVGSSSFVLADIPGLIEGAHQGVGLGHDFLRHVERTKLLLHVVDVSGLEGRDPIADYKQINEELRLYNEQLSSRRQIVLANKMDLPEARENYEIFKQYIEQQGLECYAISAATGDGLNQVMQRASQVLAEIKAQPEPEVAEDVKVYETAKKEEFTIRRDNEDFIVEGKNIERLVAMTNFDQDEALLRFQRIWRKSGIESALRNAGAKNGDSIVISDMVFEFKDETVRQEDE